MVILVQGVGSGGGNYEGNANVFLSVDTSGTSDYLLDNQSIPAQLNYIYGLYGEVTGNGRVRGPWSIFGARVQFNGWISTMSHMTSALGLEPTAGQQCGETISLSSNNLYPSGDWSALNGKGVPEDYSLLTVLGEAISFDDSAEPGGAGRYFGVSNASVRCRIIANLTKTQSGFIRGAFFYRGDEPVEIVIEDPSGSNTIYMPIDKYTSMGTSNSWKLYRVSAPTNDKIKAYRLRITVDAGKTGLIGCSYFSSYNACILPTFCGWSKSIMRNSGTPGIPVKTTPIGFICYRTSPASFPSDPVIAWQWNGSSWLKINASA